MNFLEKLLDFLKENVPWVLLGYSMGKNQDDDLKKENVLLKLELRNALDAEKIKDHNANLSDDDLKSEILSSGRDKK